jgi:transposase
MARRKFTAEFKAKVVLEIISGSKNMAEVCREYSLKADLLSHWKAQFLSNASKVFESASEADPQQARIAELERLAGKQSLAQRVVASITCPQQWKKANWKQKFAKSVPNFRAMAIAA